MELVNLIGDRLFLDYLITSNFNYSYVDNKIQLEYNSHLEVQDIDNRLFILEKMLEDYNEENNKNPDIQYASNLKAAIEVLNKFKEEIVNGYHILSN